MCLFKTPAAPDPKMPPEYAAQKAPSEQAAKSAGTNMKDRLRAASSTILTSAQGVGSGVDTTGKKTLLGA